MANTLTQMFYETQEKYGKHPMFFSKDDSKSFRGETFGDVFSKSEALACVLLDLGIKPGDKLGLMADNRVEWAIADMGSLLVGACNVPRGSDSTPAEIQYILDHSESRFCFIENETLLKKVEPIFEKLKIEKWIILDKAFKATSENILSLNDLLSKGESLKSKLLPEVKKRANAVKPDDLFTIIYTSGTTGMPKGVMLSHQNMIYNVHTVPEMVGMKNGDRTLSILPVWHIFERAIGYGIISAGASMGYTNVRDLREDFQKIKPTFMASAPRLWENLYQGIKSRLDKAEESQRKIFDMAYTIVKEFKNAEDYLNGNRLQTEAEDLFTKAKNTIFALFTFVNFYVLTKFIDGFLFAKIRDVLGGNFRGSISGGGALPAHVDEFFNVIGIPVYEGYGMTECAPIISVRTVGKLIQGSVGFTPEGTTVRVLNDAGQEVPTGKLGVIHIKGPQVMKGYYKNKEATDKVLKDGWMNTGDLGFKSFNGTLSVRGRVKDTIVLLGGENVEPIPIENLLLESPFVDQVIVVGQDQKSLTALVWPNFEKLEESKFKVSKTDNLNANKEIRSHFQNIIKTSISSENGFKGFEKLTDFRFLPKPMEVGDELTNLFKMKRNVITDKYAKLIKEMYS